MSAPADLGRGLAFPVRLGADGRVAMSDGEQNVREAIEVILRTELGERLRAPDFGADLGRALFAPNTTATWRGLEQRITLAIGSWEPRVSLTSVVVEPDPGEPEAAVATIAYRLIATGNDQRLSVSIPLQP